MATVPRGDAGVGLCTHSANQGMAFSHVTQHIIIYRNSAMAAGRVNLSILNDISLSYQNVEVSKLYYLLLKGCGHLYNLCLRPAIKLLQSN